MKKLIKIRHGEITNCIMEGERFPLVHGVIKSRSPAIISGILRTLYQSAINGTRYRLLVPSFLYPVCF